MAIDKSSTNEGLETDLRRMKETTDGEKESRGAAMGSRRSGFEVAGKEFCLEAALIIKVNPGLSDLPKTIWVLKFVGIIVLRLPPVMS